MYNVVIKCLVLASLCRIYMWICKVNQAVSWRIYTWIYRKNLPSFVIVYKWMCKANQAISWHIYTWIYRTNLPNFVTFYNLNRQSLSTQLHDMRTLVRHSTMLNSPRKPVCSTCSNTTGGMDVCLLCVLLLSGRGLCDELVTRPEESYRLWRVVVCDQETSWYGKAIARAGL
jgi:hypothetical protein